MKKGFAVRIIRENGTCFLALTGSGILPAVWQLVLFATLTGSASAAFERKGIPAILVIIGAPILFAMLEEKGGPA